MYFIVKVKLPGIKVEYLETADNWFDAWDAAVEKYGLRPIRVINERQYETQ